MSSSTARTSVPAGNVRASGMIVWMRAMGDARPASTTSTPIMISTGLRMTVTASLCHAEASGSGALLAMRGARSTSSAGSSTSAASIAAATTRLPAMAIVRRMPSGNTSRASRLPATVMPLTRIARPDVASVRSTACSGVRPAVSSSRNRCTRTSA